MLAAVVGTLVSSIAPQTEVAFAQQQDEDVSFVSNVEMIRGHIMMAVDNKEKNNIEFAQAHSTHPIAELYSLIESEIGESDEQLNAQLKTSLTDLSKKAESLSAADFKNEADRINSILDDAVGQVVAAPKRADVKFNAQVINSLLSTIKDEYEEAVKDGKIVAMIEYHDAQSFRIRAEAIFNSTASKLAEEESGAAKALFTDLEKSMNNNDDPARIETVIDGIVTEIKEGAGIEDGGEEGSTNNLTQYIENARQLLKQLSVEYQKGNFTGAEKLAALAYLENYENVESELKNRGSGDLVDQTEQLMRIQLREMIQNRVTQEQLDAHIDKINEKLDQAAVVVPEFPVSVVLVMASIIGLVVAVGKFRMTPLFDRRG